MTLSKYLFIKISFFCVLSLGFYFSIIACYFELKFSKDITEYILLEDAVYFKDYERYTEPPEKIYNHCMFYRKYFLEYLILFSPFFFGLFAILVYRLVGGEHAFTKLKIKLFLKQVGIDVEPKHTDNFDDYDRHYFKLISKEKKISDIIRWDENLQLELKSKQKPSLGIEKGLIYFDVHFDVEGESDLVE